MTNELSVIHPLNVRIASLESALRVSDEQVNRYIEKCKELEQQVDFYLKELNFAANDVADWIRRSESCESKLGQLEANERVMELEAQLADCEESNNAVADALEDVEYSGSYADGVEVLKQQLATIQGCYETEKGLPAICEKLRFHAMNGIPAVNEQVVSFEARELIVRVRREMLEELAEFCGERCSGDELRRMAEGLNHVGHGKGEMK